MAFQQLLSLFTHTVKTHIIKKYLSAEILSYVEHSLLNDFQHVRHCPWEMHNIQTVRKLVTG